MNRPKTYWPHIIFTLRGSTVWVLANCPRCCPSWSRDKDRRSTDALHAARISTVWIITCLVNHNSMKILSIYISMIAKVAKRLLDWNSKDHQVRHKLNLSFISTLPLELKWCVQESFCGNFVYISDTDISKFWITNISLSNLDMHNAYICHVVCLSLLLS